MEILSLEDIETCSSYVDAVYKRFDDYCNKITRLINAFQNEHIVETFSVSGNFGQKQIDNLESIKDIIRRNNEKLSSDLIPCTKKYLETQERLNQSGR